MKQEKITKEKIISIRIDSDIYIKLEKYCKRFRIKKSKVVNNLLFQFLK